MDIDKNLRFENIERKKCGCSETCEYSCTTCPIDSEVVSRWESFK